MRLLVLDPGIDVTGWALVQSLPLPPITPAHFRAALLAHGSLRTAPEDPLPVRLGSLHRQLATTLSGAAVARLVVEVPKYDGLNRAKRSQARTRDGFTAADMALCNRAIGALLLSGLLLGMPEIETLPASGTPKAQKSAWVLNVWPELGHRKSNADERDAIHLASMYLRQHPQLHGRVA